MTQLSAWQSEWHGASAQPCSEQDIGLDDSLRFFPVCFIILYMHVLICVHYLAQQFEE